MAVFLRFGAESTERAVRYDSMGTFHDQPWEVARLELGLRVARRWAAPCV